ncbi:hypothetical protein KCP73_17845 [Salmonella enterica subsp. enterica]|nr:hypothetical protein KCP73_17845 [Salmonella enterica subsp. enterica]
MQLSDRHCLALEGAAWLARWKIISPQSLLLTRFISRETALLTKATRKPNKQKSEFFC